MNIYIQSGDITDMQGPCAEGFHVPLLSELNSLCSIFLDFGWIAEGGNEYTVNSFNNIQQYLFAPADGYLWHGTGEYVSNTVIWWHSCNSTPNNECYSLNINSTGLVLNDYTKYITLKQTGKPIRPFKDTPITPDSSWTVLYQGTGTAGIYHNSTLGLISLSSDGINWITISDKNLGATTVYNYGGTLSEANCGKFYQRGNNNGFTRGINAGTTSSTAVDASSYGPGNYYSSSTFITTNPRDSSNNKNLRGGVTGPVSMKEVQNIYIGKKPYDGKELCFTAQEANSTVTLNKYDNPTSVTLETSTDGETWSTYTFGTTITLSNVGDKVYWRNTSTTTTGFSKQDNYYRFSMTGTIAASGDLNYLINKNSTTTLVGNWCFYQLFENCPSLTSAPELPATTLTEYCYTYLFGRTSITTPPKLPATTLAVQCYSFMFWKCTNLNALPELKATTLKTECYRQMFQGCTSIKLSSTQTGEYQTSYRIPATGTGTAGTDSLKSMFGLTGGTFTGTPSINTTYYTSNTVV